MSEITVEKTAEDSASKSLRVTVPVDRVREAEAKALKYYVRQARLPGFRPGKAPEAVVRKRFGDAIRQSVLQELIRESWETARSTESLKPITDPSIRNLKFEDGSPIEFDLLVEVQPELKLERTGGFRIERPAAAVADGAVEEQLARVQEQKATWIPVEGVRPIGARRPANSRCCDDNFIQLKSDIKTSAWTDQRFPSTAFVHQDEIGACSACPSMTRTSSNAGPTTSPAALRSLPRRCAAPRRRYGN